MEMINMEKLNGQTEDCIGVLMGMLDEGINDVENGRIQTVDEAWRDIDGV